MWFCLFGFSFRDYGGQTAVHNAAGDGHEAVVRLLLEKEVDFEARDKDGKTALHREMARDSRPGGVPDLRGCDSLFLQAGSGEALQWHAGDVRSG
jgi:ankyrin repeat protein